MADRAANTARSIASKLYRVSNFATIIIVLASAGTAGWLAEIRSDLFYVVPPLLLLSAYMYNLLSKLHLATTWTMADIADDLNVIRNRMSTER